MNDSPFHIERLTGEIRAIIQSRPGDAEALIEEYLEEILQGVSAPEKLTLVENLIQKFKKLDPEIETYPSLEGQDLSRLLSVLLGKEISVSDLSSEELLGKLALSLNTIFDTVNQIIGVIRTTLLGQRAEMETIRLIIGSQLEGDSGSVPLQGYLDQIQQAFLVAHKAFQQAAHRKVRQILAELDPEKIESSTNLGLKFGPLRKAELFDLMKRKYLTCKRWFESGRIDEEFLREFEKACQELYQTDMRRVP